MKRLENGSIEVDSAYMANRLAIANGLDRNTNQYKNGLSLSEKPTPAASNEKTFFDDSLTDFALTRVGLKAMMEAKSGASPTLDSWYHEDWQPPESWVASGLTPPGVWQEKKIIIPPERARAIETVLDAVIEDLSFKDLRANPGLEDFRSDLPRLAKVSERLFISKAEASFIMDTLNGDTQLLETEGLDTQQAA